VTVLHDLAAALFANRRRALASVAVAELRTPARR
jgi:hypothetical protein